MHSESWKCDIDGCDNDVPENNRGIRMDVIFTTEQTEGRGVEPYISKTTSLDICKSCLGRVVKSGKYIRAHGAQGYNTYEIQDGENGK